MLAAFPSYINGSRCFFFFFFDVLSVSVLAGGACCAVPLAAVCVLLELCAPPDRSPGLAAAAAQAMSLNCSREQVVLHFGTGSGALAPGAALRCLRGWAASGAAAAGVAEPCPGVGSECGMGALAPVWHRPQSSPR